MSVALVVWYSFCMSANDSANIVRFTANGQIEIPSSIRKRFGIDAGTKATLEITADGILIKPMTAALIRRGRGILKQGDLSLKREWAEHKRQDECLEEN